MLASHLRTPRWPLALRIGLNGSAYRHRRELRSAVADDLNADRTMFVVP